MSHNGNSAASVNKQNVCARIMEVISAGKPASISELVKVLGKSPSIGKNEKQRKQAVEMAVCSLRKQNKLFEHPKAGQNRSIRFGTAPPDPKKYLRRSDVEKLQGMYRKLIQARVRPADILAAAAAKLDPPVELSSSGRLAASLWQSAAVDYIHEFSSKHPNENCPLSELYRATAEPRGVSLGEFHDGLRSLWDKGLIRLLEWTQPLYSLHEERFALIADKEIRYYASVP